MRLLVCDSKHAGVVGVTWLPQCQVGWQHLYSWWVELNETDPWFLCHCLSLSGHTARVPLLASSPLSEHLGAALFPVPRRFPGQSRVRSNQHWTKKEGSSREALEKRAVDSTGLTRADHPKTGCFFGWDLWPRPFKTCGKDLGPTMHPKKRFRLRPFGRRLWQIRGNVKKTVRR